jgi:hypothetical protein
MKSLTRTNILVVGVLGVTIILLAYYGFLTILKVHDAAVVADIDTLVAIEKEQLISVADLTRQNNGNDAVNKIIIDCVASERNRFDDLLNALSKTISKSELEELDVLFNTCADYYAVRKAVMTLALREEVTNYTLVKKLRNTVRPYQYDVSAELDTWKRIAESEMKWSDYFSNLVVEQGKIIALFKDGKNATSPEVLEILAQVKDERAQLDVLSAEINEFRKSISDL